RVPDARDHHVSFAPRFEVCPAWSGARRVTDRTVGLSAYLYGAIHAQVSGDEDDLAGDASLSEQFVRLSRLGKRKPPRDQRLDLSLLKEIEQGDQVLVKLSRSQPFEPLDTVRDHPFPAREEPAARRCTTQRCGCRESVDG